MKLSETLHPTLLWKHFDALCSIPHPSKHEEKVVHYVASIGKQLQLETVVDLIGNVIIKKPATKGFEQKKTVVLQAHLDMVPQKNSTTKHDFVNDPIVTRIEDGWVKATNTTLGADNGIGAASILAVLESDTIAHGPLEALFTVDEETGMGGAFGLKNDVLSGTILINTDTEDVDELVVGCAGGIDLTATFTCETQPAPENHIAYTIMVKGLKGGHSGIDIALGRGNANVLLACLVAKCMRKFNMYVAGFDGGNMRNAIPREAHAIICVQTDLARDFLVFVKKFFKAYEIELKGVDDHLNISCKECAMPQLVFTSNFTHAFIKAITCCLNGVIKMEAAIEGAVQTSTNLSIIETKDNHITVSCLLRSSSEEGKLDLGNAMKNIFTLFGAEVHLSGAYPGWKPSNESEILSIFKKVYPTVYGKHPKITVVHAGLECGIIGDTYKNMDMISCGPTIKHPHSPDESVDIASVATYWELLLAVLKEV